MSKHESRKINKEIEYLDLSPKASPLMESLRDIGYSMDTALADIMDNSITALASNIHIRASWNNGKPWIAVIDDGCGMSKKELIDAMRFGSTSPLAIRKEDDLGRFGLGLKTASISQCRCLQVISKKKLEITACEWDLDRISDDNGQWLLGVISENSILDYPILNKLFMESLSKQKSGTIVLWKRIDRVEQEESKVEGERLFNQILSETRHHLELVFHRFLSPIPGKKRTHIFLNGDELTAFNPFNPHNLATQELPEQKIFIEGHVIVVQPYVLPHHNKVSLSEYKAYEGPGGYLHNQGFYIYRNRRLIIKGTWFRLIKKEELNKLIRIRVDIPNTLDHLWKIDVKKSNAFPPENIRKELKQIISKIEVAGRKVYKQRGHKYSMDTKEPFWYRIVKSGIVSYEINQEHFLFKQIINSLDDTQKLHFKDLITMFEQSFPRDLFYADIADNPEQLIEGSYDDNILGRALDIYISAWGLNSKLPNKTVSELLMSEPFIHNKQLTEQLLKNKGMI